ncbi:MAG: chromosomal replication initiator protein DnaA, partial [Candidatus Spechtbacteria bacterium]|nr:chromosomal replication initiator protein DnaA [Candidatus Spechtbacteria bacterium]
EHVHTNIRELEGTLNILLANFRIKTSSEITLEKAQACLRRIIRRPRRVISLKKVLKAVASFYDVTEKEILSQNRKRDISHPRQVLMYLMREEMKNSYPLIGTRLGGRDHTTVIHAYTKISEALRNNNEQLAEEIGLLKQDIYSA